MLVKIGRRQEKRFGAIFTCLNSRAIHIELAASLSTDSAVMAIRSFRGRRGDVRVMYSDNLLGAEAELKKALLALDGDRVTREFADVKPAPHFGGVWERLIKTVKKSLYNVLNEKVPKEETLQTLLVEMEFLVNIRPLTYVSSDPDDPESITPNHILLRPRKVVSTPPGRFHVDDEHLRRQLRIF
jgi:hypothetical protein